MLEVPDDRIDAEGLYCEAGNFFIDPWEPVERALVTHAHSDHARPGSAGYLCAAPGEAVLRRRIPDGVIQTCPTVKRVTIGDARVSFHPAGHILGSAQIRVEHRGEVWVVSGDYKRQTDPTCVPFEPVTCHTFITEATFALPIYAWDPPPPRSATSPPGGGPIATSPGRRCCSATCSGRRSGSSPSWRARPTGRSTCMAPWPR